MVVAAPQIIPANFANYKEPIEFPLSSAELAPVWVTFNKGKWEGIWIFDSAFDCTIFPNQSLVQ